MGESFDYIGSSRAAFDMKRGYFPRKVHNHLTEQLEPIDASQLEGIIEVQQLGTGDGAKLYALADGAQVRNGQSQEQALLEGQSSDRRVMPRCRLLVGIRFPV